MIDTVAIFSSTFGNISKDNNVYVIRISAHTSQVLLLLDVTGYGPFNTFSEREVNARATSKLVLDAFDVADVLRFALSDALTVINISSGFKKSGVRYRTVRNATISLLDNLQYFEGHDG